MGLLDAEACLDEAQHRGVVEHLRVHPATAAPRRDHVHRHARAGAEHAAVGRGLRAAAFGGRLREVLGLQVVGGECRLASRGLVSVERGCRRRGHVVEVAVVLVEVDQQHGLAPHLGHGGERIEDFLEEPCALHRAGRARMLAVGRGRVDPAHLWQAAGLDVAPERVQVVLGLVAGQRVGDALVQRVAGVVAGRVVGVEGKLLARVGKRRLVVAAGHRVGRRAVGAAELAERAQHVVAPLVGHVLVADPAHAGIFQALGVCLPRVAGVHRGGASVEPVPFVVDVGHALRGRAVGAGQVKGPVGVGARVHGAVVAVAQREGVGQRELERDFGLLEVAHRRIGLVARPLREAATVPGVLAVDPRVRRAAHALRVALALVQVVGHEQLAVGVGLLPHAAPAGQRNAEAVAETAHALEHAEVVVERPVLLHQDDDVLDVLDGAGLVVGRNGQRTADARRKGRERERGGTGGGGAGEKVATGGHGVRQRSPMPMAGSLTVCLPVSTRPAKRR
ncbi:hypothetical protein D3C86_1166800 [compost metagenome]